MVAGLGVGASTICMERFWCCVDLKLWESGTTNPRSSRQPSGYEWYRMPMAVGVRHAPATTTQRFAVLGQARHPRPHGRFSGCWQQVIREATLWPKVFVGL